MKVVDLHVHPNNSMKNTWKENLWVCPTMKLTTLEKVCNALDKMEYEVKVPEDIRKKANRALERMLKVSQEPKWSAVADH